MDLQKLLRIFVVIKNGLGADHLHADQPGSHPAAQQAEGQVRHPCHGGQYHVIVQRHIADCKLSHRLILCPPCIHSRLPHFFKAFRTYVLCCSEAETALLLFYTIIHGFQSPAFRRSGTSAAQCHAMYARSLPAVSLRAFCSSHRESAAPPWSGGCRRCLSPPSPGQ